MILSYALKFIGATVDLRKFLFIFKDSKELLTRQILKQSLLYENDIDVLKRRRKEIWKRLLRIDLCKDDYTVCCKRANGEEGKQMEAIFGQKIEPLDEKVIKLIDKDLKRSF